MKLNIKLLLIIIINSLFFVNFAKAQPTPSEFEYQITGTVAEENSQLPLGFATVQLIKDGQIVNGAETDEKGNFKIFINEKGVYTLKISYIGFQDITKDITINNENPKINLGNITLNSGNLETEEIVVQSERSAIEFNADKKVFNVEKSMTTQGGTAVDVIKNLPSVEVDIDGNISFRGNQNVKILIDGKPYGMNSENRNRILEQIPAEQVEKVELISNPSAKYEAEGTTGIINLVLKKNNIGGYNGGFTLNAGTRDKYAGAFNLNFKNSKLAFSSSYDYRLNNFTLNADNFVNYFTDNSTLSQTNTGSYRNQGHLLKTNLDYYFDKQTSISSSLNYNDRRGNRKENSVINIFNSQGTSYQTLSSTLDEVKGFNIDAAFNFTRKFSNPKDMLTMDLTFNKTRDIDYVNVEEYYTLSVDPSLERFNSDENNNEINIQSDYVKNFGENSKIETGIKGNWKISKRNYDALYFDYNTGGYVNNINKSNLFNFDEQIYSAYITYSGNQGILSYNLGLRAEQANSVGELETTNNTFKKNYFDIFPSAVISAKLGMSQQIQLSYSRRINRPAMQVLNPFRFIIDPINSFQGNPELQPEYINSLELSYIQYTPFGFLTPSIFYRNSNNMIARSRDLLDSIRTVTSFNNYGNVQAYGLELVFNTNFFKIWSLNGSVSYYRSIIDAENLQQGFKNDNYTWGTRLTSTVKLPDIADLQMTYFYSGIRYVAQGRIEPFQSFDVVLKRNFMNNRFDVGLKFSDIFNTMKFNINLDDPRFYQTFTRKRDTQNVSLIFTYRFGADDSKSGNDKKRRPDNNNNQGDGFGF